MVKHAAAAVVVRVIRSPACTVDTGKIPEKIPGDEYRDLDTVVHTRTEQCRHERK